MAWRRCGSASRRAIPVILLGLGIVFAQHSGAAISTRDNPLFLEVFVNGQPTYLIAEFLRQPDERIAIEAGELGELGINAPATLTSDEAVFLDSVPGLTYRYDEPLQIIEIDVVTSSLQSHVIAATPQEPSWAVAQSDFGAVLNYGVFGSVAHDTATSAFGFNGVSAQLDGRVFGSWGILDASGILGSVPGDGMSAIRLNTTWTTSLQARAVSLRAGDIISGGLAWTRPIRMGGVQIQRNFAIRPDLITLPLPSFSGSAAVPSTVDVFVNNVQTFSRDVPAGPFTLADVPVVTGNGIARLVVTDVTGRQTETSTQFFASAALLAQGLVDFGGEIGVARTGFATEDDAYGGQILGSGGVRYGLSDRLTVEAHAEAGAGLVNAGVGIARQAGTLGVFSLAGSASLYNGAWGGQIYGAFELDLPLVSIQASTRRSLGDYNDLAGVSGEKFLPGTGFGQGLEGRPPRAIDTISAGLRLPWDGANLSLGYVHYDSDAYGTTDSAVATYSQALTPRASLFLTGYSSLSEYDNSGLYAGLSISLGDRGSGTLSVSRSNSGTQLRADYAKPYTDAPGSLGWRLSVAEGVAASREASVAYHGGRAQLEGRVWQYEGGTAATAYLDGAIAFTRAGVFLSNRIDDAFAVVDVGVPDIEVFHENRPIGVTGADGNLLVTGLRSYQLNRIAIDPTDFPINAEIPDLMTDVTPADRGGAIVDFEIEMMGAAAVVVLVSADGTPLPVGAQGTVEATGDGFTVGYDGRAYIDNLSARNAVTVTLAGGDCAANFVFVPQMDQQVVIEQVVCR